jgi:macrolide-specific efflux system membrane fusion protein
MSPEKRNIHRRSPWRRLLVAAIVVGAGTGGFFVFRKRAEAQSSNDAGAIVAVERQNVAIAIQEVGAIEAFRKVDLKSKVAGQVAEVTVDVGSRVKAGDVLVRLDPKDVSRELRQAEARQRVNRAAFEQAESLLQIQRRALAEGGISTLDVTRTQGDAKRLEAQLGVGSADEAILRDRLSYTELRAPIDGVVLARNVQPGEMVTPGVAAMVDGKPLLVVAQVERLLVRAELNQIDVVRLTVDQPVTVKVDALSERSFQGKVFRIAAMAQKSERRKDSNLMVFTVDVVVDASQPGAEALRPGMMADLRIDLGSHDGVLAVPLEAIVREGDKTRLRKLEGQGQETMVDVVTGYQNERVVEIVRGIALGDRIRVRPAKAGK